MGATRKGKLLYQVNRSALACQLEEIGVDDDRISELVEQFADLDSANPLQCRLLMEFVDRLTEEAITKKLTAKQITRRMADVSELASLYGVSLPVLHGYLWSCMLIAARRQRRR
jgi:hypothetical protein